MPEEKENDIKAEEFEGLLEKREKLDAIFQEKFTKVVTVMFTDLKGSTSLADREGDISSRILIKHYFDIIVPSIQQHKGVLVKTIGDGTLSYFGSAQDALRAAAQIQCLIDQFIVKEKPKTTVLLRVGLHTGRCIIEKNDIFGDVVNTASRFESIAEPGAIFLSEDTYNLLSDKSEVYCRYMKTTAIKGKQEPFKVYKAFWNKDEIQEETPAAQSRAVKEEAQKRLSLKKLLMVFLAVLLALMFLTQGGKIKRLFGPPEDEKRSVEHSAETPAPSR